MFLLPVAHLTQYANFVHIDVVCVKHVMLTYSYSEKVVTGGHQLHDDKCATRLDGKMTSLSAS